MRWTTIVAGATVWVMGLCGMAGSSVAQGTAFTYQGELSLGGVPVNGTADLKFALFTAASGGSPVSSSVEVSGAMLESGRFTQVLDFGKAWDGSERWVEISVRSPSGNGSYVVLSPRQKVTAAPYAGYAAGVPWSGVTGVPANVSGAYSPWVQAGSGIVFPSGDVMIGAANPSGKFHVLQSQAGTSTYYGTAIVEASGACSLELMSSSLGSTSIYFSTPRKSGEASVRYDPINRNLTMGVGGQAMVMASDLSTQWFGGMGMRGPQSGTSTQTGVFVGVDENGNSHIEMNNNGGTPYIDFARNLGADFQGRIILNDASTLQVQAANVKVVGNFINASDARDKRDVRPVEDALSTVEKLRGVKYRWNERGEDGAALPTGEQIGFVAQEVESVLPELVVTDGNGRKGVSYVSMVPVLVEALKQERAERAKERREMEDRISRLERMLERK